MRECMIHDRVVARVLSTLFPICSNETNGALMQIHMLLFADSILHNQNWEMDDAGFHQPIMFKLSLFMFFWFRSGRWQGRAGHPWTTRLWGSGQEEVGGKANRLHPAGKPTFRVSIVTSSTRSSINDYVLLWVPKAAAFWDFHLSMPHCHSTCSK